MAKMTYALIDAEHRTVDKIAFDTIEAAMVHMGLASMAVDMGSLPNRQGIAVFEHGLFVPIDEQFYFSIGDQLYGGNAVIWQCDEAGETIDLVESPRVTFYVDGRDAELAMQSGEINQPCMAVNGEVLWVWPEPHPLGVKK